jgi:TetR/AcrR family transcriptional repressor for divergent bdcA
MARTLGRYSAPGRPADRFCARTPRGEALPPCWRRPRAATPLTPALPCLAIEGARCKRCGGGESAARLTTAAADTIRRFVAVTHPTAAVRLTD